MPQVASEAQAYSVSRTTPTFRPVPAPDQASATPFASLLNDSTQSAPDSPPPPASEDSASRADQPDQTSQPAEDTASQAAKFNDKTKSSDAKSSDAKSSDDNSADKPTDTTATDKPADGGKEVKIGKTRKTAGDTKETADGKMAADATICGQIANVDAAKPVSDGKPADAPVAVNAAAVPAAAPVPATAVADMTAAVIAPVPDVFAQATAPATIGAVTGATIVATAKTKPGVTAAPQAGPGKTTDESKLVAKDTLQPQTGDKPQAATGEDQKDTITQTRGEIVANNHRAVSTETPATLTADSNVTAPQTGADAAQPSVLSAPTQQATAAAAPATAPQLAPQAAAVPLAGVAIEIVSKATEGKNHFEIRLDPPELGRIEVRLDVDKDGNMTASMIADRSDTLDLLRRDAPGLERALQDAGLKTDNNSLQFSLRDQSSQQQQDNSGSNTARLVAKDTMLTPIDAAQRGYSRLAGQGSGIDIHV